MPGPQRVLWCTALCSVVLGCTAEGRPRAGMQVAPPSRTLRNVRVDYALSYPRSWRVTGQVVATEFAVRAACQSVRVVDFEPPVNSGPSAEVRHSFVQICWKRADGSSLDDFMRSTYGSRLSDLFERTTLGASAVPAYRTKDGGQSTTFFLQRAGYRLQIVATVVAERAKRAVRLTQVRRILASFSPTR